MTFTPYRAKTTRKATTIKAELKHNLGSLLGKVVCTPTYEGASADWIENITLEDKVLSFDVKENDSEGPRSASIAFLCCRERPESLRPRRRSSSNRPTKPTTAR